MSQKCYKNAPTAKQQHQKKIHFHMWFPPFHEVLFLAEYAKVSFLVNTFFFLCCCFIHLHQSLLIFPGIVASALCIFLQQWKTFPLHSTYFLLLCGNGKQLMPPHNWLLLNHGVCVWIINSSVIGIIGSSFCIQVLWGFQGWDVTTMTTPDHKTEH